jgi:hypothetical protein
LSTGSDGGIEQKILEGEYVRCDVALMWHWGTQTVCVMLSLKSLATFFFITNGAFESLIHLLVGKKSSDSS